jgi:flagellar hook-associated protein 2
MAGLITVGGLATGLDTNSIIAQLMKIEQRPLDLLQQQQDAIKATQSSVATVASKLATLKGASDALGTVDGVLLRKASSSDETVLSAAAGAGAKAGSVTINVTQLARASVASSAMGVASADASIAAGSGQLVFQVGNGAAQTVGVDAGTTLAGLVDSINELDAGVTASAVNLGTAQSPDWRLAIASGQTGAASSITVLRDDTTLGVTTTQAGQDARFTIAGFSGTFSRDANTFSDVLPGVTFALKATGASTVSVANDTDAIVAQVKRLVTGFNDVVGFVASEATVDEAKDKSNVTVGTLATDSTVRRLVDRLHETLSSPFAGAAGRYVNLSSIGISTNQDGTISLDETKLRAALGDDPNAVAAVFAGNDAGTGIAASLSAVLDQATGPDGTLTIHTKGLSDQVSALQNEIDDEQRRLTTVQANLQAQFAALETLVNSLQNQGNSLLAALGATTR